MSSLFRITRSGRIILLAFLSLSMQLFAQRIIPPPILPPTSGGLELTSNRVNAEITNQVAHVTVRQVFINTSGRTLEGTYLFPLPDGAAVSDFTLTADGKTMSGEILSKDEARSIYEEIVRKQLDPALLEYAGYRLFKASIFPVPPGKDREITLRYTAILPRDGDLVQFSHPLGGRIAVNNHIPAARGMTVTEKKQSTSTVVTLVIDAENEIRTIYSPSHTVDIRRRGPDAATVSYEGTSDGSENSFILYYALSSKEFSISMIGHDPDTGEDGFFMMLINPRLERNSRDIISKDVVFILDKSGSMEGEKIDQAKAALSYCLKKLDDRDRFTVITFSTDVRMFRDQLVSAGGERLHALTFVGSVEAGGGTNIDAALEAGLGLRFSGDRPVTIVFLTDGLPTAGTRDAGEIIRHAADRNRSDAKIFTFGVGYDVNTFLLDKIAASSKAVSDYIEPQENIEERVSGFFSKISSPVLTDVTLDFDGIRVYDMFPRHLPDLYQGEQVTILGRYTGKGRGRVTLRGSGSGEKRRIVQDFNLGGGNDFLPHLWASRKVGYLTDEIRLNGENREMKKEIIKLSKRYGIVSIYTSYLVQEDEAPADAIIVRADRDKQAGGHSRVQFSARTGGAGKTLAAPPAVSGMQAVKSSMQTRELKEAEAVAEEAGVRRIGTRTFILKDEFWTESTWNEEKTRDITYGSEAYRNLLLSHTDLARCFALGEKVILKVGETWIKISP